MASPRQSTLPVVRRTQAQHGLRVPEGAALAFRKVVMSNTLEVTMNAAYDHVVKTIIGEPLGTMAPVKTSYQIKIAASASLPTLFSGLISYLDLKSLANPVPDVGHATAMLEKAVFFDDLVDAIGQIKVNVDEWTSPDFVGLKRVHKDAEIMGACFLAWHTRDSQECQDALALILKDLTLDARKFGNGAFVELNKLELVDKEEESRDYVGLSAANKSHVLQSMLSNIQVATLHNDVKGDAEKVAAFISASGNKFLQSQYKPDTIRRYLAIAKMMTNPDVRNLFARWEVMCKRNALVDTINVLRGVMAACKSQADFLYICNTLFLEQRAKLRSPRSVDKKKIGIVAKAIIIRRSLITHMKAVFPKWLDLIDERTNNARFKADYNVEEDGTICGAGGEQADDGNSSNGENSPSGELQEESEEISTYKSRPMLNAFLRALMVNRWERTLLAMAQAKVLDLSGTGEVLDLSSKQANLLKAKLDSIEEAYANDFKPAPVAAAQEQQ